MRYPLSTRGGVWCAVDGAAYLPIPGANRVLRVLATGTRLQGEYVCLLDVTAMSGDHFSLYLYRDLLDQWNEYAKGTTLPMLVDLVITPAYSKHRTKVLRYDVSFAEPSMLAAVAS